MSSVPAHQSISASPTQKPRRFTPFPHLPTEIRLKIWGEVANDDSSRLVYIHAGKVLTKPEGNLSITTKDGKVYENVSPLIFVNRECREVTLKTLTLDFSCDAMDAYGAVRQRNFLLSTRDTIALTGTREEMAAIKFSGNTHMIQNIMVDSGSDSNKFHAEYVRLFRNFQFRSTTTNEYVAIRPSIFLMKNSVAMDRAIKTLGNMDNVKQIFCFRDLEVPLEDLHFLSQKYYATYTYYTNHLDRSGIENRSHPDTKYIWEEMDRAHGYKFPKITWIGLP